MKKNGLNHYYKIVWNAALNVWQAVAEISRGHGKSKSSKRLARRAAAGLVAGAFLCISSLSLAADILPTGGNIVGGSGTISSNGSSMTITQNTASMAADWQSFSIGQGNSVNFVQPSASSVAFNRVLGADVSTIQGALNANGQVFLLNPNGVLFTPSAQVNVGGIVASTLSMSTADFMAGNYTFAGSSSNAIINQGNITAVNGGTIALIAAKIINDGNLTANLGNVLLGAASQVTLDLGGPVKLLVENDVLETLISNGGAIKADGGTVLLTSQAAATLASSVINNTGLIEAQSLTTGENGEIVLFAHGGTTNINGTLHAAGGFIETSGKHLNVADTSIIKAKEWLLDPTNITIESAGSSAIGGSSINASFIATTLNGGTGVTLLADNDIHVNEALSWTKSLLKLTAGRNINVNASLNASGTGSLAVEYGQATTDGSNGSYSVDSLADIYIPQATAFTWKKGSAGTVNNLVFDNAKIRFGDGVAASLTNLGTLKQPWYYDEPRTDSNNGDDWFQLTYSSYPLDIQVGVGGDGSSSWNQNGILFDTDEGSYSPITTKFEISGYREGYGSIASIVTLDASTQVKNTYTLTQSDMYLKTVTEITNIDTVNALSNLRVWVGTRDDYIALNDRPTKTKGNLASTGFEAITIQNTQAKALKITENEDGTGAAVLFYSTSAAADIGFEGCCSFTNVTGIDPRTSAITISQQDGSYALFMRMADLAPSASSSMTWFYAAGPVNQLDSIITQVAVSAGVAAPVAVPAVVPAVVPLATPEVPVIAAVTAAQAVAPRQAGAPLFTPQQQLAIPAMPTGAAIAQFTIGSLEVVALNSTANVAQGSVTNIDINNSETKSADGNKAKANDDIFAQIDGQPNLNGQPKIFVLDGGISLPSQANSSDE